MGQGRRGRGRGGDGVRHASVLAAPAKQRVENSWEAERVTQEGRAATLLVRRAPRGPATPCAPTSTAPERAAPRGAVVVG